MLSTEQQQQLYRRLVDEFAFKDQGEWLRKGRCPSCNKKDLYAHAHSPWNVTCGRLNNCGWQSDVKALYPECFENWSKRYPATQANPTATADAYLREERGLDLALLRGTYTQENYLDRDTQLGTPTVRFSMPGGGYWERLLEHVDKIGKKARFNFGGGHKGYWWHLPSVDLSEAREVWIVEGIFDAVALSMMGKPAVSIMSSNLYPDKALDALRLACATASKRRPTLVWALDNDKAGRGFTCKFADRANDDGWRVTAAQIPVADQKNDWNDLLKNRRLGEENDKEKLFKEALHQGRLLLAKSAVEYALERYNYTEVRDFWFIFHNRLFWWKLDIDKFSKALETTVPDNPDESAREAALKQCGSLSKVAGCAPRALYHQRNEITDESWYYFKVDFPNGGSIKNTFTPGQITAGSEWKKRLAGIGLPGGIWTGSADQLNRFVSDQTGNLKTVKTIDFIGYSKQHEAWVLGDVAVKNGKSIKINAEDYFDMNTINLKSLQRSMALDINHDKASYSPEWFDDYCHTYGDKGLVVLAFWFGSLFSEQIRDKWKMFPFLEMIGEPGSGKTTLVKFLWKLCGRRDYEGFDPNKATAAGRARSFVQLAGLPVVLMEGDADMNNHNRRFNWEDLKPLYNGNSMRATGMRTGGNETYEPPFRGSIVIEQNQPVDASDAILSRIVQLNFDRSDQTEFTYQLAKKLENWPMDQLSYFILKATMAEGAILERLEKSFALYEPMFQAMREVREFRIAQNHALILSLVDCLELVVPITTKQKESVWKSLQACAISRQQTINADHPLVQQFWEAYEYLDAGDEPTLNHSCDKDFIAVNLNHVYDIAERHNQRLPPITEMKHLLKNSRQHAYVDQRAVKSAIFHAGPIRKSVRCWRFAARRA